MTQEVFARVFETPNEIKEGMALRNDVFKKSKAFAKNIVKNIEDIYDKEAIHLGVYNTEGKLCACVRFIRNVIGKKLPCYANYNFSNYVIAENVTAFEVSRLVVSDEYSCDISSLFMLMEAVVYGKHKYSILFGNVDELLFALCKNVAVYCARFGGEVVDYESGISLIRKSNLRIEYPLSSMGDSLYLA